MILFIYSSDEKKQCGKGQLPLEPNLNQDTTKYQLFSLHCATFTPQLILFRD